MKQFKLDWLERMIINKNPVAWIVGEVSSEPGHKKGDVRIFIFYYFIEDKYYEAHYFTKQFNNFFTDDYLVTCHEVIKKDGVWLRKSNS